MGLVDGRYERGEMYDGGYVGWEYREDFLVWKGVMRGRV